MAAPQVWRVRTGQCLRRFDTAHTQGITSLAFSRDGTHVLSASYDSLIRWVGGWGGGGGVLGGRVGGLGCSERGMTCA